MSADPRLVLVVGPGRSGTSLLTAILGELGFHVPRPEVSADDTNPRGFGEPRWVVEFHNDLLRERRVTVNDARPSAWDATAGAADDTAARRELREWLGREIAAAPALVVKDPRTSWFLPLWIAVAADLGVPASFVTTLRHPAEALASALTSYGDWQTPASRTAAWVNVSLGTERLTRGQPRAFVRYDDLLSDWARELTRAGEALSLPALAGAGPEARPRIARLVDPSLRRQRTGWDAVGAATRVTDIAERVWDALQPLASDGGDTDEARQALDEARAAYRELYDEAESVAQSSLTAASRAAPAPTLRMRIGRRVPLHHRRRVRRAIGSLRRS
jgi:hypothetical protein